MHFSCRAALNCGSRGAVSYRYGLWPSIKKVLFYWAPAELPVNSYGLRPYKKRSESCDFLIEHLDLSTRRLHCVIEVIRIEKGQVGCDHGEAEFPEAHGQCDGEVHADCQE